MIEGVDVVEVIAERQRGSLHPLDYPDTLDYLGSAPLECCLQKSIIDVR